MKKLAKDLGIKNLGVIVNKVRGDIETLNDIIEKELGLEVFGFIPYDEDIIESEFLGKPADLNSKAVKEIKKVFNRILKLKSST